MTVQILQLIQGLSGGGAARSMIATAKYSPRYGNYAHKVISMTPASPDGLELIRAAGLEVINAPSREILLAEMEWADIVHVNWWNSPELYELFHQDLPPLRLLIWMHVAGDHAPQVVTQSLVDFADLAVACSQHTYELPVFRYLPDERKRSQTGLVLDPADFDRLRGLQLCQHPGFNVGYIGTVGFEKMHPQYVQMSAKVNRPQTQFIVCGQGQVELLHQQAVELGAADRFDLRGYVQDIRSVLEILDVYGYPLCEGTYAAGELNLQEAMFAGIPPVVFPHGGVKYLVQHNQTGLVVHSEDEYSRAIEFLFDQPKERQRLGRNASEYARKHFGAENSARQINPLYDRLLQIPKRKRLWGTAAGVCLTHQPATSAYLGLTKLVSSTGAEAFTDSLGDAAPQFTTSLRSIDLSVLLQADEHIANSPAVLTHSGGGILHYREFYPQDGYLNLWAGLVLQRAGQFAQALQAFGTAVTSGTVHWRAAWYLAQTAEKIGDRKLTAQALQIVNQAAPNFKPAHALSVRMGFTALSASNPSHPQCVRESWVEQAEERFQKGDLLAAEVAIRAAITLAPQDVELIMALGNLLLRQGKLEAARLEFVKAVGLAPDHAPAHVNLAGLLLHLGQAATAEEAARRALDLDPENAEALKILARLSLEDGRCEEGLQAYRKVLQRNPKDTDTLLALSGIYNQAGDLVSAGKLLKRAVEIDPQHQGAAAAVDALRQVAKSRAAETLTRLLEADDLEAALMETEDRLDADLLALVRRNAEAARQDANGELAEGLDALEGYIQSLLESRDPGSELKYTVSAIVSTYKSERFIRGCLQDLVDQTLFATGELEIVVVDSASPENEGAVVEEFRQRYGQIVYIRTQEREGLYAAWNRGIRAAHGSYITNANTDDRHRCDALEILARALDGNPDVDLVYGDCYQSQIENETYEQNAKTTLLRYPEFLAPAAVLHYQLGPQPMWRKRVHDTIGFFDEKYQAIGDYDFNIRFALAFRAMHIPETLGLYLKNPTSISFRDDRGAQELISLRADYWISEIVEALYRKEGISWSTPIERARVWVDLGLRALEFFPPWDAGQVSSDLDFSRACFEQALKIDPTSVIAANNLAGVYALLGRGQEAEGLLKGFLDIVFAETLRFNLALFFRSREILISPGKWRFMDSELGLPFQREISGVGYVTTKEIGSNKNRSQGASILGVTKEPVRKNARKKATSSCRKLLLACDYFWPSVGGVEIYVADLGGRLQQAGYEVEIAARWLPRRSQLQYQGLKIHSFHCDDDLTNSTTRSEMAALKSLVVSGNYKAVICLSEPGNWVSTALATLPSPHPRLIMLPSISSYTLAVWQSSQLLPQIVQTLQAADQLVCATENGFDQRVLNAARLSSCFIPHAVAQDADRRGFRSTYGFEPDRPLLVMVANFWPVKNHLELLQTLSHAPGDWQLAMIGHPIAHLQDYYQQVVAQAKQDSRVKILNGIAREQAAAAIRDADLLLVPSLGESAGPLVVLQAMSYGTPWVATPNCNAVGDEAGGIVTGLEDFPGVIAKLLVNSDLRREMGFLGQEHWQECFTWEKTLPAFTALIEGRAEVPDLRMPEGLRSAMRRIQTFITEGGTQQDPKLDPSFHLPLVSVIIPTYNRRDTLKRCLQGLADQTYPADRYEVLVCDDGSTDATVDTVQTIVAPYRLIYLSQENHGPASARNLGIRKAKGDLLLILNDDAIAAPDLIERHVHRHQELAGGRAAVLGSFDFLPELLQTPLMLLFQNSDFLFQFGRMQSDLFYDYGYFWTCNISLPRQALLDIGLFDEDFHDAAGEDIELGYRLEQQGYRILFDPTCVTHHDHRITLQSFYRRQVSVSRNAVLMALKHPDTTARVTGIRMLAGAEADLAGWVQANENKVLQAMALLEQVEMIGRQQPENLAAWAQEMQRLMPLVNTYWIYQGFLEGLARYTGPCFKTDRSLRISILTPGTTISGGVKVILEYCNRLAQRGHQVTLLSESADRPDWFVLDPRVKFIVTPVNDEALRRNLPQADILIATIWYTAYFVARMPAEKGVKFYLIQDYEAATIARPEAADPTYLLPLRRITVSHWLSQHLQEKFGQGSQTIPISYDPAVLFPDLNVRASRSEGEFRVGMLYHHEARKGVADGQEAFRRIRERLPRAKLVYMGASRPRKVECDEFHANLKDAQVREFFNSLDVFVSTSYQEGFGLPGLEALACGVPLVTTDSGGVREYAIDGETALVTSVGNPESLAEAVLRLAKDSELRANLRAAGLQQAARFSWERSVESLEESFLAAIQETRSIGLCETSTPHANRMEWNSSSPRLGFYGLNDVSGPIRITLPAHRLRELGYSVEVSDSWQPADIARFDAFFFSRPHLNPTLREGFKACYDAGKTIILDLDDNFHKIPPKHPAYQGCGPGNSDLLKILESMVQMATVLIVSTPQLAEFYGKWARQVVVIPNGWSVAQAAWLQPSPARDTINLGWAGTITHREDVLKMKEAVIRILREFPQTRLVIGGDEDVLKLFATVPSRQKVFLPYVNYQDYPSMLAQFDILLAPLRDNEFNRGKSDIKLLEAGIRRIPWVASPAANYQAWGEGGLLAGSSKEWYGHLKALVTGADLRQRLGETGFQKAQTREMDALGQAWVDLLMSLGFSPKPPEETTPVRVETAAPEEQTADLLRDLLDSRDILASLERRQDELNEDLLRMVRRDMELAEREGEVDLAEGLCILAEYIAGVMQERKLAEETNGTSPTAERAARRAATPAVRLLETLLAAEDLPAALREREAELDGALLELVRENAGAARSDGDADLAEGLDALADYISGALAERAMP